MFEGPIRTAEYPREEISYGLFRVNTNALVEQIRLKSANGFWFTRSTYSDGTVNTIWDNEIPKCSEVKS